MKILIKLTEALHAEMLHDFHRRVRTWFGLTVILTNVGGPTVIDALLIIP